MEGRQKQRQAILGKKGVEVHNVFLECHVVVQKGVAVAGGIHRLGAPGIAPPLRPLDLGLPAVHMPVAVHTERIRVRQRQNRARSGGGRVRRQEKGEEEKRKTKKAKRATVGSRGGWNETV